MGPLFFFLFPLFPPSFFNYLGNPRQNPEEIDSIELSSINRLEYICLPKIAEILEKWEIMPIYNLLNSNCQTHTRNMVDRILKASNANQIHLPGTNIRVSIGDKKKLHHYVEKRFPNWTKKQLVLIPEVQTQYAIKLARDEIEIPAFSASDEADRVVQHLQEVSLEEEYDELVLKQNGFESVCKALNGKVFSKMKNAVFFHLCKENVPHLKDDGELKQEIPPEKLTSLSEIVSEFWKYFFKFMAVTMAPWYFPFSILGHFDARECK